MVRVMFHDFTSAHLYSEILLNKWNEWPGLESWSLICGYASCSGMNLRSLPAASINDEFRLILNRW